MRLIPILIVLLVIVGGVLLNIHGTLVEPERSKNLLQMSSALMNLCLIGIVGGAVSFGFKQVEFRREQETKKRDRILEEQRALRDFRESFLKQFLRAYHNAKAARRELTRHGLTVKASDSVYFDEDQIVAYETQMTIVQDSQLAFEEFVADIANSPHVFSESSEVHESLKVMEQYLREILREYEINWRTLNSDPGEVTLNKLPNLGDFTGRFRESRYRDVFIKAKNHVLHSVRNDLLPQKTR